MRTPGWVHAVGADVTAASVGDAVLVYPPYSCGLCVSCRRGIDMHCERHQFTGLTRDGGFAEYVLVDERSLLPLPEGVDPAAVAPHADAGDHRLPRGQEAPPTPRSRHAPRR